MWTRGQNNNGVTPTNITPSNITPATITSGGNYHATAGGYAIESYTSKTPTIAPYPVDNGKIYKMEGDGYILSSYTQVLPTIEGTYFSSGLKNMSISGYAYSVRPSGGIKHYTTNVTFNDNTTYQYIATGQFIACSITRTSVATAPTVQVFVKEGSSYTAVSAATSTVNGEKTFYTTSLTSGELYIKKNNGSNFASTAFDFQYI